jgi:Tol biopolymer transport system component
LTHKRKLFLGFCFSALVSTAFSQFYTDLQQITFSGKRSGEGYFSREDSKLVYQSENVAGNPFYQIYTLDLRTGQTRLVSNEIGKTTCAWFHPNNVDILYSSTHLDPLSRKKQEAELEERIQNTGKKYSWDYDKNYDLFLKNIETNNLRRLT